MDENNNRPPKSSTIVVSNPYRSKRRRVVDTAAGEEASAPHNQNHHHYSHDTNSCNNIVLPTTTTTAASNPVNDLPSSPSENKNRNNKVHAATTVASTTAAVATTATDASALVISATDKAGMDGIDRQAIDAIIIKESGNSLYMQQQRRRDEKVNERIIKLKQKLELREQQQQNDKKKWRARLEREMDADVPTWIAARSLRSVRVVVDMDQFYMGCELLSKPDFDKGTPACVGGPSMILTSNYASRRYGVRSAMPGYIGSALVRQLSRGKEKLVYFKSNFDLYKQKSQQVRDVLSEFDPNLSAYSLDEAYMDLTQYLVLRLQHPEWTHEQIRDSISTKQIVTATTDGSKGENSETRVNNSIESKKRAADGDMDSTSPDQQQDSIDNFQTLLLEFPPAQCQSNIASIVADMRQRVYEATGGLTCSAGVAPNFLLAKIASDRNKPNGQLIVPSDQDSVLEFLHPLPIRKVSGIGRVTEKILKAFGIETVQQLYQERALVGFLFDRSSSSANFLLRASVGCSASDGKVPEDENDEDSSHQKGISRERTFSSGKTSAEVYSKLEDIARLLSSDMQQKDLSAHTVSVKVKLYTFDVFSRARTMPNGAFVRSPIDLTKIATELLQEIRQKIQKQRLLFSVRLLGIRCSNLRHGKDSLSGASQTTIDRFLQPVASVRAPSAQSPLGNTSKDEKQPGVGSDDQNITGTGSAVVSPYSPMMKAAAPPHCVMNDVKCSSSRTQSATQTTGINITQQNKDGKAPEKPEHHPTTSETNEESATESPSAITNMECPVCGKVFQGNDEIRMIRTVNQHVDSCLNGSAVRKAIREEEAARSSSTQQKKEKRPAGLLLTEFFATTQNSNNKK